MYVSTTFHFLASFMRALLLGASLLLLASAASAQPAASTTLVPAQFTGNVYEYLTTDGQQQPTGRLVTRVAALRAHNGITRVELRHDVFDATDHAVARYLLPARVPVHGSIGLDLRAFLNPHLLRALSQDELLVAADSLASLPSPDARAGEVLPEASLVLALPTQSSRDLPVVTRLSLRSGWVAGREEVATPAGIFNCLRLTHDARIETDGTATPRRIVLRLVTWYAPEAGIVKLETYVGTKLFDSTVLQRVVPGVAAPPIEEATAVRE